MRELGPAYLALEDPQLVAEDDELRSPSPLSERKVRTMGSRRRRNAQYRKVRAMSPILPFMR